MTRISPAALIVLMCGAVTAQLVAGKATRDALFLMMLGAGALPAMLIGTAVVSVLLVVAHARAARRVGPRALVSALFAASGALYLAEWFTAPVAPMVTAVLVYLHVSIAGPLLASGFWLVASDHPGPRSARARFGGLAGAGALGGLIGALLTERVAALAAVDAMLLILGGLQFLTAVLTRGLATDRAAAPSALTPDPAGASAFRSGLRVVAEAPHLRALGALVLLGAASATLLDYVFKVRAVESYGLGEELLRFFAIYHAAVSVLSFVLQSAASRVALERFGLGLTTSSPSIALLAGSVGSLVAPGLGSLIVARGAESAFRVSWFRAGYELFYTPLRDDEKRSARTLIDLGLDRMGDALGGAIVLAATSIAPTPAPALVALAMAISAGAVAAGSSLNRWYVRMLEGNLVGKPDRFDPSRPTRGETARIVARVRARPGGDTTLGTSETTLGSAAPPALRSPLVRDIRSLRSRNPDRALGVLARDEGLRPGLVAHAIPLLGVEALADHAEFALRKVAEERIGELTDALLDEGYDPAVRRRLARVFSGCVSQRAADAVALALADACFEVRAEAGRSLSAVLNSNPGIRIDRERMFDMTQREIAFAHPARSIRAGESLSHVFTLLSLVLPREPLLFAWRALERGDPELLSTAIEYLESVLPPAIRRELIPRLASPPEATPIPA